MPPEETGGSPLDTLRKKLYSTTPIDIPHVPSGAETQKNTAEHWKTAPSPEPTKPRVSGAALFLGAAMVFFVVAGSATALILFLGGRSVSTDHLEIRVPSTTSVPGGEAVPLLVTVKNDNPVAVTNVSLTLTYPQGTKDADDTTKDLTHYSQTLPDIPAGGSVQTSARASFFGKENETITIPITVEYRTGNSNAVFVKKSEYTLVLSTSPVAVTITTLKEVASGQKMTISALVRSNASTALQHVAVRPEYPFGFSPRETSIEPTKDGLFYLGTLAPGEEREVRITGTLAGQDGEERVFKFTAGSLTGASAKAFATTYTTNDASVFITKPFFAVALALNREEAPEIVVREGESIAGLLTWTNALPTPIADGAISVALSGDALDTSKVDTTYGFYQSAKKTIEFNRDTASGLASLNPGDTGNGSFVLMTKTGEAMRSLRNPSITLAVSIAARRVGENKVPETITSTITRTIKIQSDISLAMRAVRTVGPFKNTGPWPPVADTESTYTLMLTAGNTVNTVANTVAKMKLPSYVRFTGAVSPQGAVIYNEATREVTWTVGDMPPGATREAAFQVALLPSVSQKGTSPALVSDATLSGIDRFVKKQVSATAAAVDTELKSDPAYQTANGVITP